MTRCGTCLADQAHAERAIWAVACAESSRLRTSADWPACARASLRAELERLSELEAWAALQLHVHRPWN